MYIAYFLFIIYKKKTINIEILIGYGNTLLVSINHPEDDP